MTEINFQPVFDYIDSKFVYELGRFRDEILTEVRAEIREVRDQIANMASEQKRFNDEMEVSRYRTTKLGNWAKPVGKKLNLPFTQ